MSGHPTSPFADLAADNLLDGDDNQTLLHSAGPTGSDSDSDEEQQNQLPDGRELRRWITRRGWTDYIQADHILRNRQSCDVSIFRVPKLLKGIKKELYVPQRVSLGPYHHGSAELPPMGRHKGRALHRMMTRYKNKMNPDIEPNNMDFANRAMEKILTLEDEIRNSYEENIDCKGKTLARMLSLDGCFLLEVLRTMGGYEAPVAEAMERYDPIFGEKKLDFVARDIQLDILMLENQIPLVVLLKLLELEGNSPDNAKEELLKVLVKALWGSFTSLYDQNIDREQLSWPRPIEEVPHLLGFFHTVIASPPSSTQDERGEQGECISIGCCISECIRMLQGKRKAQNDAESIPHATELRNVGINFSPLQTGGIKAIRFEQKSSTIFLPRISITAETEIIFRNLIAFDMCKPSEISYLTCYVSVMDELIDSELDVALLSRMGVLTHGLGSDKDVADVFNGLCKGVTVSTADVLQKLRKDVNAHHKSIVNFVIAIFVQDHCSTPWKGLALMGSVVLLLLTLLQTMFTILQLLYCC